MDPNMLAAAAPYCDASIQNRASQSMVRSQLFQYYQRNPQMRGDYITAACKYATALMAQNQPWQNAITVGAEAVASMFIVNLAKTDQAIQQAFAQDPVTAQITQANAAQVAQIVYAQNNMGFQQQNPSPYNGTINTGYPNSNIPGPLAGAMTVPAVMTPVANNTNGAGVRLAVPGQQYAPVQTTQTTAPPLNVQPPAQQNATLAQGAKEGLPRLFNQIEQSVEYIKLGGKDYFKDEKQMDPNAHNVSPAYLLTETSKQASEVVFNNMFETSALKSSSVFEINAVENKDYTRLLETNGVALYAFADLCEESLSPSILTYPNVEMLTQAHLASFQANLPASSVMDKPTVLAALYDSESNAYETVSALSAKANGVVAYAENLHNLLKATSNKMNTMVDVHYVTVLNTITKVFIESLCYYVQTSSKKANLPSAVFTDLSDIPDLVKWLKGVDMGLYGTLMEPAQFKMWLAKNFYFSNYENDQNVFTIECCRAYCYTTYVWQQLDVSFAKGCDKAMLNMDENPWLYNWFVSHITSEKGRRQNAPMRFFFFDGVVVDVTSLGTITGNLILRLVK